MLTLEQAISHVISDFGLHRIPDLPMQDMMGWAVRALRNIGSLHSVEDTTRTISITNYTGRFPQDLESPIRVLGHQMHTMPNNLGFRVGISDGSVELVYTKMITDSRGYPMVPDNEPTLNAIAWFIAHKLCLQDRFPNAKMTIPYCEDQWQWYCGQARAEGYVPTLDGWERMVNISHRLLPPQYSYDNDFVESEVRERDTLGVDTINFSKNG